jgi:hypothetical protein
MFGVGQPTVQKKQESTTTPEERAILNAIAYWNYLQQQRLEEGLPLQSQEEFHEYMMAEKAKYYKSLEGETSNDEAENSGKTEQPENSGTGNEGETPERNPESGVPSTDVYPSNTGDTGVGNEVPETPASGGGSTGPDVTDGTGGIE